MTLRALAVFALFSCVTLASACTGSDSVVTPSPTATSAPPQLEWLTTERRDLLLSTLKQLSPQVGWVAGCVFESKANQAVLNAISKPAGRAFFSEFTDPALGVSLAVRVEGTPAWNGDYVGAAPNLETFCFVPQ